MRASSVICAVALSTISVRAGAQAAAGSACSARSECGAGLHCLRNVCVDEATFSSSRAQVGEKPKKETIGYVGAALGTSLPVWLGSFGEAFQVGLRIGTVIDDSFQLQLEASPLTTAYLNVASSPFSSFDVAATLGTFIHLNDFTSWILRIGGGGGGIVGYPVFNSSSVPPPSIFGFGELRLDFFGVAIRTSKHLLVEVNAPSFRMLFLTQAPSYNGSVMLQWVTNVALNYVF